MNKEKYLCGIYSMKNYTVAELERMLEERYAGREYEVVCDTNEGLLRVYTERERKE